MLVMMTGFLAAGIGAFYGVSQSVRTVRSGTTAGVSRVSWVMSSTTASLWMTYGALERSAPQLLANAPWFLSCVLIGAFMARERVLHPALGRVLPWVALGASFWVLSAERSVLGVIGPVIGVGVALPQLLVARRSDDVSGLSTLAWTMSVVSGVLWVVFGIGTQDWPVVLSSVPATCLNALVLLAVLRGREERRLGVELDAELVAA